MILPAIKASYVAVEFFGSENTVAGVAEARQNISVVVQALIERSRIDIHVGMIGLHTPYSFGGSHEAHQADVRTTFLFQHLDRVGRASSRSQHRIGDDDHAVVDVFGQFAVVENGVVRFVIAVETDMSDLGHRKEVQQPVDQAQPGAQDRHDGQFFARYFIRLCAHHRCLDFYFGQRKIASHLIAHQHGDLFEQIAKIFCTRVDIPYSRQLMLNHGMIDNMQLAHVCIVF